MGGTRVQDGYFFMTYTNCSLSDCGTLYLRRLRLSDHTQMAARGGRSGICSDDANPICIKTSSTLFSGTGRANARIFLTGGTTASTIGTIYSDDDGVTWHNWQQSPNLGFTPYAVSGAADLGPTGDVVGAFTQSSGSGSVYFFHTN
jgi:hypothetical protein